jgi:SAM-dependent methyltransferase
MRLLALLLCLLTTPVWADVYYDGRFGGTPGWYSKPQCNNPRCAMDNYIRMLLRQEAQPAPANLVAKTRTRLVKRCNGRRCWYETVVETYYIQQAPPPPVLTVTELHPTPPDQARLASYLLAPTPEDLVADLGCGDGRVIKQVVMDYGCTGLGIELNPQTADKARQNCKGLPIKITTGNVLDYSYDHVDIVYVYLYQKLLDKVVERLAPGTKVVSYMHSPHPTAKKAGDFFLWTKP